MPSLEILEGKMEDICSLFRVAYLPRLRQLRVLKDRKAVMPWSVLRQTLQGIGTNCPALEDLQLYAQMVPMAIPSNTTSITVCALRHLLPCRTMKGLQISLWCDRATPAPAPDDFNPSDRDWNTIAEA